MELMHRLQAESFDVWQELTEFWQRLSSLIKHVDSLQTPLSRKIAAARVNEYAIWGRTQTPTLLDTGRLIFRSQVTCQA